MSSTMLIIIPRETTRKEAVDVCGMVILNNYLFVYLEISK